MLATSLASAQSTINPTVPAQNAPLASAPMRGNFANAYADINGTLSMHPVAILGNCPGSPLVGTDCLVTGSPTLYNWYKYMGPTGYVLIGAISLTTSPPTINTLPQLNNGLLLGNCTGTSPAQAAGCTWGNFANQAISSTNGVLPYRTGGAWSTISVGTSGATLPLNNTSNIFSALQAINLNGGALVAPQTGTAFQISNAVGSVVRAELDAYAASTHFSGARYNGTVASPTVLVANNEVASLSAFGYDGSQLSAVGPYAGFRCFSNTTWAATVHGTYCDVAVTANTTSAALTGSIRFENDGGITVPATVTGGDKGVGTINAGGLFINGVAVSAGGSVNPGTLNQLAYYAAAGSALSGFGTVNNGVVSTGGTGIPTVSTTLPSGIAATSMALTTPAIGAATGTSLALGGASLGGNVLAVNGGLLSGSISAVGVITAQTSNAAALAVGANGATNPAFQVDSSAGSQVAGLKIAGSATAGTVAISTIDSGANTNLGIDSKGGGQITLNGNATGPIVLSRATTISAALTYGGVTLSNSVIGTGPMVLGTAPSISSLTVTTAFTATGLVTFADMATAAISTAAQYQSGASNVVVPASQVYQPEVAITFGATTTIDFTTLINGSIILTGNISTMNVTALAGKSGQIRFLQDATGSRTTVWSSVFKFPGGATPILSTAANAVDVLFYSCITTASCYASLVQNMK